VTSTAAPSRRDYSLVTAAYWAFTLSDGALRMLVLLHFHALGYSPFQLSILFLSYEALGVFTNFFGGWVGTKTGLLSTLFWGLALQVAALVMLARLDPAWPVFVQVAYVLASQGASGVAKDLTKLSAKSAVKALVRDEGGRLFRLVAILTGSKNALKGVGFFLGSALLSAFGFEWALYGMAASLALVLGVTRAALRGNLGQSKQKLGIRQLWNKSPALNWLSLARFFLFSARDVWFTVALPVFLYEVLDWSFLQVGTYMALWVIGYGMVQSLAPALLRHGANRAAQARSWGWMLALVPGAIAAFVHQGTQSGEAGLVALAVLVGLAVFGVLFAVNSSLHSYLVLAYADTDRVTADVGFYYTANAAGRLLGCAVSGISYQLGGLVASLLAATGLLVVSAACAWAFPKVEANAQLEGLASPE
jgi:MFS family permease